MLTDDDLPKSRSNALAALLSEDLTPLSVAELEQRITTLQAEIARSQSHLAKASAIKLDAEALFRKS